MVDFMMFWALATLAVFVAVVAVDLTVSHKQVKHR